MENGKVIDFYARYKKEQPDEWTERISRIHRSIARINQLIAELKGVTEEAPKQARKRTIHTTDSGCK